MTSPSPDSLQSWWMPFTHNRHFKAHPRLIESASGAYYTLADGRRVFDCLSGLWCTPLGHAHPTIVHAVRQQVSRLDFSPGFQMGHAPAFELASQIVSLAGRPSDRVFFVNSGSEAVDTALKIAIAYHRVRGEASRTRVIGRERGYHGVGLGGISVGGIASNRKMFAPTDDERGRSSAAHLLGAGDAIQSRSAIMGRASRRGAGAAGRVA